MPTTKNPKATIYFNDGHLEVRECLSFSHLGIEVVGWPTMDHGLEVIANEGSEFISSHAYMRVSFDSRPTLTVVGGETHRSPFGLSQ